MASSRWTDSFHLQLNFKKPNQREEEALRDFVSWLKQVRIDETAASTPLGDFIAEIRTAAQAWLTSPSPGTPPGDFMSGSPASHIMLADVCDYTRAAMRVWVTELRPKWIARWHGCAPTHFDVDDKSEEECVLLAELVVPIVGTTPGNWTVADTPAVIVNEEHRPFVVHLRMLQELLWCGPKCCDAHAAVETEPEPTTERTDVVTKPEGLPPYRIVAAGIVGASSARRPVFNNLLAKRLEDGTFLVRFNGYRRPEESFQYVVKALPVSADITNLMGVTFVNFTDEGFVLRLNTSGRIAAGSLDTVELMVEVSEVSGASIS